MCVAGSFSLLIPSLEMLDGVGCLVKEGYMMVMMSLRLVLLDAFRRQGGPLRRVCQLPLPVGLNLLLPRKQGHDKIRVIVDGLLQVRDQVDLFQNRRVDDFVSDVVGDGGQLALNLLRKREDAGARARPGVSALYDSKGKPTYTYLCGA